jgi:hypothetical protein
VLFHGSEIAKALEISAHSLVYTPQRRHSARASLAHSSIAPQSPRRLKEKIAMTMKNDRAAADVVRACSLLWLPPEDRDELRDILRRWIAGLPPEKADAALVELFHEIQICDDVEMESRGW